MGRLLVDSSMAAMSNSSSSSQFPLTCDECGTTYETREEIHLEDIQVNPHHAVDGYCCTECQDVDVPMFNVLTGIPFVRSFVVSPKLLAIDEGSASILTKSSNRQN